MVMMARRSGTGGAALSADALLALAQEPGKFAAMLQELREAERAALDATTDADRRVADANARIQGISDREAAVNRSEQNLAAREQALFDETKKRGQSLSLRESRVANVELEIVQRIGAVAETEKSLLGREEAVGVREAAIPALEARASDAIEKAEAVKREYQTKIEALRGIVGG